MNKSTPPKKYNDNNELFNLNNIDLKCDTNYALNKIQMQNNYNANTFNFHYTCEKIPYKQYKLINFKTNPVSSGNDYRYMDNHDIKCDISGPISQINIKYDTSENKNELHFEGQCYTNNSENFNNRIIENYTRPSDHKNGLRGIDNHKIKCPEESFITNFRMMNYNYSTTNFVYNCEGSIENYGLENLYFLTNPTNEKLINERLYKFMVSNEKYKYGGYRKSMFPNKNKHILFIIFNSSWEKYTFLKQFWFLDCNFIYINDPINAYYIGMEDKIVEHVNRIIDTNFQNVTHIISYGQSMGGYFSLLFSSLFKKKIISIAVNPQTFQIYKDILIPETIYCQYSNIPRIVGTNNQIKNLRNEINKSPDNSNRYIFVGITNTEDGVYADLLHAGNLVGSKNTKIIMAPYIVHAPIDFPRKKLYNTILQNLDDIFDLEFCGYLFSKIYENT